MNCEKTEEILSLYLEGELSHEEKNNVKKHLKTCRRCSLLLSCLEETKESLSDFPNLEVSESLLDRLYSIPSKKERFRLSMDFLLRPSLQPVLASATILLTLLSFYIFHPNKSHMDKSINRQIHLGYSKIGKLYAKAESFTDSLGEHKDNIIISLKKINPLGRNED